MNAPALFALTFAVVTAGASASPNVTRSVRSPALSAECAADTNYQRLAFWVGDWEVVDSLGAHYATQRVRPAVDGCALTVEWTGHVGDRGLSVFAFDASSRDWKQMYLSNQVPVAMGIKFRHSDPAYQGPGLRFVPLDEGHAPDAVQTRVTIMPLGDRRAMQLFEDSSDGGKTWRVVFKGEHRLLQAARAP